MCISADLTNSFSCSDQNWRICASDQLKNFFFFWEGGGIAPLLLLLCNKSSKHLLVGSSIRHICSRTAPPAGVTAQHPCHHLKCVRLNIEESQLSNACVVFKICDTLTSLRTQVCVFVNHVAAWEIGQTGNFVRVEDKRQKSVTFVHLPSCLSPF